MTNLNKLDDNLSFWSVFFSFGGSSSQASESCPTMKDPVVPLLVPRVNAASSKSSWRVPLAFQHISTPTGETWWVFLSDANWWFVNGVDFFLWWISVNWREISYGGYTLQCKNILNLWMTSSHARWRSSFAILLRTRVSKDSISQAVHSRWAN